MGVSGDLAPDERGMRRCRDRKPAGRARMGKAESLVKLRTGNSGDSPEPERAEFGLDLEA